jgi:hypothetical protein
MSTTGYSDTFNRTVSNGLGSASSGQTYTLSGTATQFSVAPSVASIAISAVGDNIGYIDRQTQDVDITAQVALSAIPTTNLATVGFVAKMSNTSNYYNATMMVAAGGAVSLRFSKNVGGGLSTISTTLVTGLTYVANTFYNLRYANTWSQVLQTNVMTLKLWAVGAAQPGGWMASAQDAAFTNYTSGTLAGIMGRDESTVLGTITTKHQSLVASSYSLPMPATTDPMCYDPAIAYPRQTALQSLAVAADAVVATIDPLTSLAGLFPRVRVSNSLLTINTAGIFVGMTFGATEFNVGTPTNLSFDNTAIYLPSGIWMVNFEIQLKEATSDYIAIALSTGDAITGFVVDVDMRSNAAQTNDQGVGGCGHVSKMAVSTDPTTPIKCTVSFNANNVATTYTATYLALTAIKISDYFA